MLNGPQIHMLMCHGPCSVTLQSQGGSNGASDDGHLAIVQYHPYHQPASSDLYQTSIGIHPLLCYHQKTIILIIAIANQHHALSTTAHLNPHQLHTYSMLQAYHIMHAPVLEVMGFGCHKVFRGFESAHFSMHRSTILFVTCLFHHHMLS